MTFSCHTLLVVYLGRCKGIQLVHSTPLLWSEILSKVQPPPVLDRLLQLQGLESQRSAS